MPAQILTAVARLTLATLTAVAPEPMPPRLRRLVPHRPRQSHHPRVVTLKGRSPLKMCQSSPTVTALLVLSDEGSRQQAPIIRGFFIGLRSSIQ